MSEHKKTAIQLSPLFFAQGLIAIENCLDPVPGMPCRNAGHWDLLQAAKFGSKHVKKWICCVFLAVFADFPDCWRGSSIFYWAVWWSRSCWVKSPMASFLIVFRINLNVMIVMSLWQINFAILLAVGISVLIFNLPEMRHTWWGSAVVCPCLSLAPSHGIQGGTSKASAQKSAVWQLWDVSRPLVQPINSLTQLDLKTQRST